MEPIQLVKDFLSRTTSDTRLTPVHLSLTTALCHSWMINEYEKLFQTSRRKLMQSSHIRSIATYHKIIKELQAFGYITYAPSYHPKEGSTISLIMNNC